MANIISSFSFNLVYPAASGDPAYPVLLLSCLPGNIYAQRELLLLSSTRLNSAQLGFTQTVNLFNIEKKVLL